MKVLEARDVTVTPPGASDPAVRGFSVQVARGEWLALTGPNGGGKSSLLLGLAGLWPARGEIQVLGRPFHAERFSRQSVAVILQDPSSQILQPTVYEEIAFGLRNAGIAEIEVESRVRRTSGELGLSSHLANDPARLSAGCQQLVLLAAALAGEPELLLADEPTAHLDRATRCLVLERVRARVVAGMSVLWVTQLTEELARADRIIEVGKRSDAAPPEPFTGPQEAADPLLRLRVSPLRSSEGPRVATDGALDIVVASRGATAILGPNGSGKSVLLWAAAGLGAPPQVAAEWALPLDPPPIAALQFPELQIFEETVADELAFAAVSRGMTREAALGRALIYLRDLELDPEALLGRRTWSLAAGEKRLLEITAALTAPAILYVLDEPTAGLDPERRSALGRLIREFAADRPVLIASQDLGWVEALGSSVFSL